MATTRPGLRGAGPHGAAPGADREPGGFRLTGGSGRRRNAGRLAGGLVLVVACAVVVIALVGSAGHRRQVLAVVRPVTAGQPISAADLRTVAVSGASGVDLVAAAGQAGVVGRPAAVPLTAGSLLSAGQVGSPSIPAAGHAFVGVVVKPGQYPSGLAAGDKVAVVSAPTTSSGSTAATPSASPSDGGSDGTLAVGIVLGVTASGDGSAGVVVTVDVPDTAAQPVAVASSNGEVSLVQRPASG